LNYQKEIQHIMQDIEAIKVVLSKQKQALPSDPNVQAPLTIEQRHPDFLPQMKLLVLRSSAICLSRMACTFQGNQQDKFDQFVQTFPAN
jgi:hypothetical protein